MVEILSKINKFLSIIVMKQECEMIIEKDEYLPDENFNKLHSQVATAYVKKFTFDQKEVDGIIITGTVDKLHKLSPVGCETAYLLSYLGVQYYKPDVLISIGYAGSTGYQKMKLGDVVISNGTGCYYLRDVIIPIYKPFINGNYPVYDSSFLAEKLGFIAGQVATSDSFLASDNNEAKNLGKSCIEMEFAAIARLGYTLGVEVIGLKIISDCEKDLEDGQTNEDRQKQFEESLKNLPNVIYDSMNKLVKYLALN